MIAACLAGWAIACYYVWSQADWAAVAVYSGGQAVLAVWMYRRFFEEENED